MSWPSAAGAGVFFYAQIIAHKTIIVIFKWRKSDAIAATQLHGSTASCAGLVIERKPRRTRIRTSKHTPSISTCLGLDDHTACLMPGDELKSKLKRTSDLSSELKLWPQPRGVQLRAALIYGQPMPQAARSSKHKQSKHFHFSNERKKKPAKYVSIFWRTTKTSPHDANLYAAPAPVQATKRPSDRCPCRFLCRCHVEFRFKFGFRFRAAVAQV